MTKHTGTEIPKLVESRQGQGITKEVEPATINVHRSITLLVRGSLLRPPQLIDFHPIVYLTLLPLSPGPDFYNCENCSTLKIELIRIEGNASDV